MNSFSKTTLFHATLFLLAGWLGAAEAQFVPQIPIAPKKQAKVEADNKGEPSKKDETAKDEASADKDDGSEKESTEKPDESSEEKSEEELQAEKEAKQKQQEAWLHQQMTQQISQFSCDRRPSAALKAWATPPKKEQEEDDDEQSEDEEADDEEADDEETQEKKSEDEGEQGGVVEIFADGVPPGIPPAIAARMAGARASSESSSAEDVPDKATKQKFKVFKKLLTILRRQITLGQWDEVKTQLASIETKKHRKALYLQILQSLAQTPNGIEMPNMEGGDAKQQMMMAMAMRRAQNQENPFPETNLISIPDFVGLVDANPGNEKDGLQQLGRLLGMSLRAGNVIDELLIHLKSDQPLLEKRNAAKMLSAAGQNDRLGDFLPSVDDAKKNDDREALNLLSRFYLAKHQKDPKVEHLESAWHVTQAVLATGKVSKKEKLEAMRRAVELVPRVREELSEAWMNESFSERPERGKEVLAAIGHACGNALPQHMHNADYRKKLLEMQKTAVELLLKSSPDPSREWQSAMNLLAQNWMREAGLSLKFDTSTSYGPRMQRDPYGNIFYVDMDEMRPFQAHNPDMPTPIPIAAMLETRPQQQWHKHLESSIQSKFDVTSSQLFLKVNEPEEAFPYIERMAEQYPEQSKQLAEEFLRVWAKNHNPNEERDRTNFYMFNWGYSNRAERIPLTRSKQNRNLEELKGWAARLRELPIKEWDESLLVDAFMTSHSDAEVYKMSDIEGVFGSIESLKAKTLATFAQRMRMNLATLWQQPKVQKEKQTHRKQKDIQIEVQRGYKIAKELLSNAMEIHPDDWQLELASACIAYDENDYTNQIQKSSEFSVRRKAALRMFAKAAGQYQRSVGDLSEKEQTVDAYEKWFYACLGSPDIGRIESKSVPMLKEIDKVQAAIEALPQSLATHHLKLFANNMFSRLSSVDPSCKVRYLREAFKIVGDHKQAHEAKKVFDYYNDLVTEIELVAQIDGNDEVGEEPFGVFVNLHHTKAIERESGGFSRYLQNQNNGRFYNYGRPTENYRDKFEEAAIAALEEQFEVLSVTFNRPNAHSKAVTKPGWRVTPYAYLLLKARGPEVDKIPPMRIDLDFLDTSGYAVLPIETSHVPIVAKSRRTAGNDFEELKIVQTLDERQASDGKLILEIKATAQGLVPAMDEIVEHHTEGFEVLEMDDQGVSVVEFAEESDKTAIKSERVWMLTMHADESESAPKQFKFASALLDETNVIYQRFIDADLEETEAEVALQRNYPRGNRRVFAALLTLALLGVIGGVVWHVMRKDGENISSAGYEMPEQVTPFTAINLLRHIHATNGLRPAEKQELTQTIERLESHYFKNPEEIEPDLKSVVGDWIGKSRA